MTSNAYTLWAVKDGKKVRQNKKEQRKSKCHIRSFTQRALQIKAHQSVWFYFILMKSVYLMHILYALLMPTPAEQKMYICDAKALFHIPLFDAFWFAWKKWNIFDSFFTTRIMVQKKYVLDLKCCCFCIFGSTGKSSKVWTRKNCLLHNICHRFSSRWFFLHLF